MTCKKRPPVMEDYLKFRYLGEPCCRNGSAAWVVTHWDTDAPEGFRQFRSEILLAENNDFGNIQRITAGGKTEFAPQLAPDGTVYFLSDGPNVPELPENGTVPLRLVNEFLVRPQLWCQRAGKAQQLTALRHGVISYSLSPDGSRIFLCIWQYGSETEEALRCIPSSDGLTAKLDEPFTTESPRFKADAEMGYRSDRTRQLWVLSGGVLQPLITSDFSAPCWMPDNTHILFQCPGKDGKLEFHTVDALTGQTTLLASMDNVSPCYDESPALIDEARNQILFGANVPDMEYSDPRGLYAIPLSGGTGLHARRLLDPNADIDGLFPQDYNFACRGKGMEYLLMPDGNVYYTTGFGGDVRIACVRADAEDASARYVTQPMQNFHSLCRWDDTHLLALCGLPAKLPELASVELSGGSVQLLTETNPWLQGAALQPVQSLTTPSGTQGFYIPPVNAKGKAPVIVFAHGGPTGFFCSALNYELQVMAAAGFGVIFCNPRGGTGFGRERSADHFAYDGAALADTEEFLDTVCTLHPELDVQRAGICGGSYGGFLTLYAAVNSRRFRAACAHRALSNMYLIGNASHSAGGHTRQQHPEYRDVLLSSLEESIVGYVDKIQIPLLMLHSQLDANCIPEQANQIFTAMRTWNPHVPCEYILYPDSCHGLNASGPMELAVQHRKDNLEWFVRHLQTAFPLQRQQICRPHRT